MTPASSPEQKKNEKPPGVSLPATLKRAALGNASGRSGFSGYVAVRQGDAEIQESHYPNQLTDSIKARDDLNALAVCRQMERAYISVGYPLFKLYWIKQVISEPEEIRVVWQDESRKEIL